MKYIDTIDGQEVEVQVIPPQIPMRRGASPKFPFIHGGQVTHARTENPIAESGIRLASAVTGYLGLRR